MIAESIPGEFLAYSEFIRIVKPIAGLHTVLHAQCIRLLYPGTLNDHEYGAVLITDMDCLPMNRKYYRDRLESVDKDTFVNTRGHPDIHKKELCMCFNIAYPSIWKAVFQDNTLKTWAAQNKYEGTHGGTGWCTDQLELCKAFQKYKGKKMILTDTEMGFHRLDRDHSNIRDPNMIERVKAGVFSDYHCLRPQSQYCIKNNQIVDALMFIPE